MRGVSCWCWSADRLADPSPSSFPRLRKNRHRIGPAFSTRIEPRGHGNRSLVEAFNVDGRLERHPATGRESDERYHLHQSPSRPSLRSPATARSLLPIRPKRVVRPHSRSCSASAFSTSWRIRCPRAGSEPLSAGSSQSVGQRQPPDPADVCGRCFSGNGRVRLPSEHEYVSAILRLTKGTKRVAHNVPNGQQFGTDTYQTDSLTT